MWNYIDIILGTHTQSQSFAYNIEYVIADEILGNVNCDVIVTALETNPSTVTISGSSISGYYGTMFDDTLTVRNEDNTFDTFTTFTSSSGIFDSVDRSTLSEVISFRPDRDRYRVFNYEANAYNADSLVATTTYQIILDDRNWTPGKNSLKELVQDASGNSTW